LAYGYEATILADICDAVLKARENGDLNYQQEHIAQRCEILVRAFARVGIIALGFWRNLRRSIQTMMSLGRRKHKHYKWLTSNVGYPKLREHLGAVVATMRLSSNWHDFKNKLDKNYPASANRLNCHWILVVKKRTAARDCSAGELPGHIEAPM
jgi:hypothetical protein